MHGVAALAQRIGRLADSICRGTGAARTLTNGFSMAGGVFNARGCTFHRVGNALRRLTLFTGGIGYRSRHAFQLCDRLCDVVDRRNGRVGRALHGADLADDLFALGHRRRP